MGFQTLSKLCMLILVLTFLLELACGQECPQSIPTRYVVNACPGDPAEWIKAKERKQCHLIIQNCTKLEMFEYHCLPNRLLNMLVEVCAPSKLIVGNHCPNYDLEKNIIEPNFNQPCKDHLKQCPAVYKSSDIYKYQECYFENKEQNDRSNGSPIIIKLDNDAIKDSLYTICVFLSLLTVILSTCAYKFYKIHKQWQNNSGTNMEDIDANFPNKC